MIIEITDMNTPMLLAMKQVNVDVAYEIMSKVGNRVRVNAKKKMNQQRHRHSWMTRENKNGERSYYYSKTEQKNLGQRTKPNGAVDSPSSMNNMISSFLMEKSGTIIVGGRNKAFTPVLRKDGKIVGKGKRQPSITAHTQSIINKLDTGKRNKFHGWGSKGKDKESAPNFKKARYIGRGFMKDGFNQSLPYMKQELTTGWEKTIGRAVNKISIKLKPSVSVSRIA